MPTLLTVIVPCYQSEVTIRDTLASVQAQTFKDWECLIVNDGSTDGGPRIAEEFAARDPRFRVIHKANGGLSSARNAGIKQACGEYIHFLDADDTMHDSAYAKFIHRLQSDRGLDVCYCRRYTFVNLHNEPLRTVETSEIVDFKRLLVTNHFPVHAAIVRRAAVHRVEGFDEHLTSLEDWDFWLRIAHAGCHFGSIPVTLAFYRKMAGTMSTNSERMYRNALTIIDRLRGLTTTEPVLAMQVERLLANQMSFYLGFALSTDAIPLFEEILESLLTKPEFRPRTDSFSADNFCYGLNAIVDHLDMPPTARLTTILRRCLAGITTVETRLEIVDLLERVIRFFVLPLTEAVAERDRLRNSTSYRLGRLITRCKPW
jgi:glycosyltransferase involved in cell wall biosynthesis